VAFTTLAAIPVIGQVPREDAFLQNGLAKVGRRTLLEIAVRKARGVADEVVVFSDDSAVLAAAKELPVLVVKTPKTIRVAVMSESLAYYRTLLGVSRQRPDFRPDVLLVVGWKTPLSRSEDLAYLRDALLEKHADSSLCAYEEDAHFWHSDGDYTYSISGWNYSEPIYVDSRFGYGIWVGDFMKVRHLRVGRSAVRVVPKWRALTLREPEHLRIANELSRH
jgi:hypothetical protein